MKKVWLLLALLLALIICCVWCRTDEIYQKHLESTAVPLESVLPTKKNIQKATTPSVAKVKKPIQFSIEHDSDGTSLNGTFGHYKQEIALSTDFRNKKSVESQVDLACQSDMAVIKKVREILPHFLTTFDRGNISYQNESLSVTGETTSQEAKEKLDTLLSGLGIDFVNNTKVTAETRQDIEFTIQHHDTTSLSGTFASTDQSNALRTLFKDIGELNPQFEEDRVTTMKPIDAITTLWPLFSENFENGTIAYTNSTLSLSGETDSLEAQEKLNELLASLGDIKSMNHTTVVKAPAVKLAEGNHTLTETEQEAITEIHTVLKVENVGFMSGSSRLTPKGKATVEKLKEILGKYPEVKIKLSGHTDSDGNDVANLLLSEKRVKNVRTQLISLGIEASRIETEGLGETEPLLPNTTAENKQKNRRVEITIIGGE
jgi:outer membrane protein OmpA-like peptidoglycan-associated protein/polyisoprenoid-binding protein YceI